MKALVTLFISLVLIEGVRSGETSQRCSAVFLSSTDSSLLVDKASNIDKDGTAELIHLLLHGIEIGLISPNDFLVLVESRGARTPWDDRNYEVRKLPHMRAIESVLTERYVDWDEVQWVGSRFLLGKKRSNVLSERDSKVTWNIPRLVFHRKIPVDVSLDFSALKGRRYKLSIEGFKWRSRGVIALVNGGNEVIVLDPVEGRELFRTSVKRELELGEPSGFTRILNFKDGNQNKVVVGAADNRALTYLVDFETGHSTLMSWGDLDPYFKDMRGGLDTLRSVTIGGETLLARNTTTRVVFKDALGVTRGDLTFGLDIEPDGTTDALSFWADQVEYSFDKNGFLVIRGLAEIGVYSAVFSMLEGQEPVVTSSVLKTSVPRGVRGKTLIHWTGAFNDRGEIVVLSDRGEIVKIGADGAVVDSLFLGKTDQFRHLHRHPVKKSLIVIQVENKAQDSEIVFFDTDLFQELARVSTQGVLVAEPAYFDFEEETYALVLLVEHSKQKYQMSNSSLGPSQGKLVLVNASQGQIVSETTVETHYRSPSDHFQMYSYKNALKLIEREGAIYAVVAVHEEHLLVFKVLEVSTSSGSSMGVCRERVGC